jgi:hypothetical protein
MTATQGIMKPNAGLQKMSIVEKSERSTAKNRRKSGSNGLSQQAPKQDSDKT